MFQSKACSLSQCRSHGNDLESLISALRNVARVQETALVGLTRRNRADVLPVAFQPASLLVYRLQINRIVILYLLVPSWLVVMYSEIVPTLTMDFQREGVEITRALPTASLLAIKRFILRWISIETKPVA